MCDVSRLQSFGGKMFRDQVWCWICLSSTLLSACVVTACSGSEHLSFWTSCRGRGPTPSPESLCVLCVDEASAKHLQLQLCCGGTRVSEVGVGNEVSSRKVFFCQAVGARVGSCGDDAPAACCSRCRACLDCCSDHEEALACFSDGCAEAMQDCVEKSEAARALQDNLACSAQGLTHRTKSTALTTTSIHRLLATRRLRFPFSPTKNPTRQTTPKSFHPIHSDFPSAAKCFTLWPPTCTGRN